jgi:hypothetical protein
VSDIDLPILEQVPAENAVDSTIPEIDSEAETALPVIED